MSARFAPGTLQVLGSGSALPGPAVDNDSLLAVVEQVAGKAMARKGRLIGRQLGIGHRHLCRRLDQAVSEPFPDAPELCIQALKQASAQAQCELPDLRYLIGHTTTPHTLVPPNVAWVVERLALPMPYLELRQACTGFANALQVVAPMLQVDAAPDAVIAIVGSEVGSVFLRMEREFIDHEQLVNVMQMGDGAGAVLLGKGREGQRCLLSDMFAGHIGNGREPGLYLDGGGSGAVSCYSGVPRFRHNAQAVRAHGADLYLAGLQVILERGYSLDEFTYILPHQVNGHLGRLLGDALGIDAGRIVVDADRLGNLGSAAIWVSLDRLRRSGRLREGDKVLVLGAEATKYLYGGFVYSH